MPSRRVIPKCYRLFNSLYEVLRLCDLTLCTDPSYECYITDVNNNFYKFKYSPSLAGTAEIICLTMRMVELAHDSPDILNTITGLHGYTYKKRREALIKDYPTREYIVDIAQKLVRTIGARSRLADMYVMKSYSEWLDLRALTPGGGKGKLSNRAKRIIDQLERSINEIDFNNS